MAARLVNLSLVLCLGAASSAFGEPSRICELAVKHGGLVQYSVRGEADQGGTRTLRADIDHDGADDELRWFDPAAGSRIAADHSTLTLTLTSNRQSFTLAQQRLSVVEFESRYYVATLRLETGLGPWYREVFTLTREGIQRICSFEGKGQAP